MQSFSYKISVVVPVYNCADYIDNCIESLKKQTIGEDSFEIVLVNDGSKDNSSEVCNKHLKNEKNITLIEQENSGVSVARNVGIDNSKGKYILFLDADDEITENTLEDIYNFFEEHYDETDIVTYVLDYVDENGKKLRGHKRYSILKEDGIYDVIENPDIVQTTMNVCVKNVPAEERVLFVEGMRFGEDQTFITEWCMKKKKIGFVKNAKYLYFQHEGSASTDNDNKFDFDRYISFLQNLTEKFSDENGEVYRNVQSIVLYNLGWRYTADCLVSGNDKSIRKQQLVTLSKLMQKIDNQIIADSIYIDPYHKEFFFRLKREELKVLYNKNVQVVCAGDTLVYEGVPAQLMISEFKIINDELKVIGCLKNIFEDYENIELFYEDENSNKHIIEMNPTTFSMYHAKIYTNNFGGFDFSIPLRDEMQIRFKTKIAGYTYEASIFWGNKCVINQAKKKVCTKGYIVELNNDEIQLLTIKKGNALSRLKAGFCADRSVLKESKKAFVYRAAAKLSPSKNVWLYCDREGIFDNAYVQFMHDVKLDDGIKRYYVVQNLSEEDRNSKFSEAERKLLVELKSHKHKVLFLNCSKVITSFESISIISPFNMGPLKWYSDILRCEVVYLQHGILHARLPLMYSKERCFIDKLVISSEFERNNFTENYNYRNEDLIASCMPRYDVMKSETKPKNKILFSPSWRKNLIGDYINNQRELKEDAFLNSDFYKQTIAFLSSTELHEFLKKHNIVLEYKNHPIFSCYDKFFSVDSEFVKVAGGGINMDEYKLMITDYSSIVFDFVYLERPILYFAPDYEQFKSGITHTYNQLEMPLEDAFGPLTMDADSLFAELKNVVERGFKAEEKYSEKMNNFFLFKGTTHCDVLYDNLIGK